LLLTTGLCATEHQLAEAAVASNAEDNGLIELEASDASEHIKNFKRISEDLMEIQEAYEQCVDDIHDNDFSEMSVDECLGKDFIFVLNDIAYERKKIISRADAKIRKHMIELCYEIAGRDEIMSNGCDLMERDLLDLLWSELNFSGLVEYNKHKYLFEFGEVPVKTFDELIEIFSKLEAELDELITEIYDHNDVTIIKLKKHVDERTRKVIAMAQESYENPQPKLFKHVIEIQEKINAPRPIDVNDVPRPMVMDSSNQMYALHNNPYVDEFHEETDHKYINGPEHLEINNSGPIIQIPDRKLRYNTRRPQRNLASKINVDGV
jgi:hypothetical protein